MSGAPPSPPPPGTVWTPPLGWVSPEVAEQYRAAREEVGAWPEAVREAKARELWGG